MAQSNAVEGETAAAETAEDRRGSTRSTTSASVESTASSATAVPRVGGVRCYWAVLRPVYPRPDVPGSKLELVFVHPDPVLGAHLAKQKMSLMGRGVIEFIHPHEREQARQDLMSAISADDLQGSVTRVRFARLSRLKMILGCPPEDIEYPEFEWSKLVVDDEYLVLDLVLNWVADGMLLAFFHAIIDLDPVANNDPSRRAEGWSNFCGTANIDDEQVAALGQDIYQTIGPPPPSRVPPTRVFQLHSPSTPESPGSLLCSWPPARPPGSFGRFDGLYNAEDYSELMRGVDMDSIVRPDVPGNIRTTCTTRFGAQHSLTNEGFYRLVASTFIPYGNVIFACFQTTRIMELPEREEHQAAASLQQRMYGQLDWAAGDTDAGAGAGIGMGMGTAMEAGPSASSATDSDVFAEQQQQPRQPPQHQPPSAYVTPQLAHQTVPGSGPSLYPTPPPPHTHSSSPTYPPLPRGPLGQPEWPPRDENGYRPQSFYPHPPPMPNRATSGPGPIQSPPDHAHRFSPYAQPTPHSRSQSGPHAPPPHSLSDSPYQIPSTSSHPTHQQHPLISPPSAHQFPPLPPNISHHRGGESEPPLPPPPSRPLIRPPGDVECCIACGTRESPEWRRSESGTKELCNACGLRLARQVAKREGKQKPRKKKAYPTAE